MRTRTGIWLMALVAMVLLTAAARAGTLRGQVTDKESGEELIACDVVLIGTGRATQTDLEGHYVFDDLAGGNYNVRVSYLGYNTKVLADVAVPATGEKTLDVKLESFRADAIDDVMVTATRIMSTDSAVLSDRKQSSVVGDAISAAQISRSPDSQAGDAMKRVTGVTVQGGQYVNVRGMPDRYNVTIVDGAVATSVDPDLDRKSFNFEMIPASLLSSIEVLKTATPDMPGDFTGGLVVLNTKEFPDQAKTTISIGTGGTSGVTGEEFFRDAESGGWDWLGIDDGGRDRPQALIDAGTFPTEESTYPDQVARSLANRWGTEKTSAPANSKYAISHGNKWTVLGREVGLVAAATYKNSYDIKEDFKSYESDQTGTANRFFEPTKYEWNMAGGLLLNTSLKLSDRHRISFKNLLGHTAEESYLTASKDNNQPSQWHVLEWEEKNQITSTVSGTHNLPVAGDLELEWRAGYNENTAKEPDHRWLEYQTDPWRMLTNRRYWLDVNEYKRSLSSDLTWTFGDRDRPSKAKVGAQWSTRRRGLSNSPYNARPVGNTGGGTVFLPPDQIFAPENFKDGLLQLIYQDQFEGSYDGTNATNAVYAMLDVPFSLWLEEFRLTGGVRQESMRMSVEAYDKGTNDTQVARLNTSDLLPSVNLTYFYDENTNVRLGYYKSLNYPDMRELAGVLSVDLNNNWAVLGNPDLERAVIQNFDLRVETFPGGPSSGQVVAFSLFHKDLDQAIETTITSNAAYWDQLTWFNGSGRNSGFEFEARKNLGMIGESFENVTLMGNYTRVWSVVDEIRFQNPDGSGIGSDEITERQLQGQSPWIVNLSLQWDVPRFASTLTVLYNKIGRRLDTVNEFAHLNLYDLPRDLLDAALVVKLPHDGKFKFTAKNILAQDKLSDFLVDKNIDGLSYNDERFGYESDSTSYSMTVSWSF